MCRLSSKCEAVCTLSGISSKIASSAVLRSERALLTVPSAATVIVTFIVLVDEMVRVTVCFVRCVKRRASPLAQQHPGLLWPGALLGGELSDCITYK